MPKKAFLISCDLRNKSKNYNALYDKIKSLGEWMHVQEPLWLLVVDGDLAAKQIYNEIRPYIENSDLLMVVEVSNADREGWMPKNMWDKLKMENL